MVCLSKTWFIPEPLHLYLFQMSVDWTREEDLHGLYP